MESSPQTTKRRIKRFSPLQLGKMLGVIYGIMGLLVAPLFLLGSMFASQLPPQQRVGIMALGAGFSVAIPFMYGAMGFILGVIGGFIYNLVAKWVGGIEVEVE